MNHRQILSRTMTYPGPSIDLCPLASCPPGWAWKPQSEASSHVGDASSYVGEAFPYVGDSRSIAALWENAKGTRLCKGSGTMNRSKFEVLQQSKVKGLVLGACVLVAIAT